MLTDEESMSHGTFDAKNLYNPAYKTKQMQSICIGFVNKAHTTTGGGAADALKLWVMWADKGSVRI